MRRLLAGIVVAAGAVLWFGPEGAYACDPVTGEGCDMTTSPPQSAPPATDAPPPLIESPPPTVVESPPPVVESPAPVAPVDTATPAKAPPETAPPVTEQFGPTATLPATSVPAPTGDVAPVVEPLNAQPAKDDGGGDGPLRRLVGAGLVAAGAVAVGAKARQYWGGNPCPDGMKPVLRYRAYGPPDPTGASKVFWTLVNAMTPDGPKPVYDDNGNVICIDQFVIDEQPGPPDRSIAG